MRSGVPNTVLLRCAGHPRHGARRPQGACPRVGGRHGGTAACAPQPPVPGLGSLSPSLRCRRCGCGFPRLCGGSGGALPRLRTRFLGIRMGPPPSAVCQRVKRPRVCGEGNWGAPATARGPSDATLTISLPCLQCLSARGWHAGV